MTTHTVFEAEARLNGHVADRADVDTYGIIFYDNVNNNTNMMYISATSESEAINIPAFRTGSKTPTHVFRMPAVPGIHAAVRLSTVGTQQWVVE